MLGSIVDDAIAPHVHKALPFDQAKDFIPVGAAGFGTVPQVVHAELPHLKCGRAARTGQLQAGGG